MQPRGQSFQDILQGVVVAINLNLTWQVKDEVLASRVLIVLINFVGKPVNICLKEFHAVDHTSIWSKLELLHHVL